MLVTGAVGSVGRVAMHAALKLGAKVIAGVRQKQLDEAKELGATELVALDDPEQMAHLRLLDAVADTVGGKTASMLPRKVRDGVFGTLLGPPSDAKNHPSVTFNAITAQPDPGALVTYAEDLQIQNTDRSGSASRQCRRGSGGRGKG